MKSIILVVAAFGVVAAQFAGPYVHQSLEPAPIHEVQEENRPLAHPALVNNALLESQYPPQWTNDQYKNPKIAEALARESWFTDKEMPVFDRVADKIPREQVFKLFKNAGFIRRR